MGLVSKKEELEDLIKTYDVIYLGGLPDLPKAKAAKIVFNLFKSNFELLPTFASKTWFTGFSIPYNKVVDFKIVQRQIGTMEGLLGGLNSSQLNQLNNIHIRYEDESGNEILLRLEMLSGITVMGQAKRCLELEDIIQINHIRKQFKIANNQSITQSQVTNDILSQIEKLAELKGKGILTDEEFEKKKTELLSRL